MALGTGSIVRFSVFELDLRSGELRKSGARVPLQGQPLEILKALLEQPGQLVTRDELRQRLWPDDTFVDFEDGMNAAIRRLRDALGDHATTPQFVETLPRRGYRFIAPIVGESTKPVDSGRQDQASSRDDEAKRPILAPRGVAAMLVRTPWFRGFPWLLSAIVIAWVATVERTHPETTRQLPTFRFEVRVPPLALFGPSPAVALSPDGTYLAYVVSDSYLGQIYLRSLNSLDAKTVSGADQAQGPFFSPDGKYLGFFTRGTLQKVSVAGGSPTTVCTLPTLYTREMHGASWGDDGNIVFESSTKLWRVSENGGVPKKILMPEDAYAFLPEVLPAGHGIVFMGSRLTPSTQSGVWALSQQDSQPRLLVEGGEMARYLRSGHLIYSVRGSLAVAPLDLESLSLTAPSVTVINGLRIDNSGPPRLWGRVETIANFTVSQTGTMAYIPGPTVPFPLRTLVWVDRQGKEYGLPIPPRSYSWPRLSPDASKLAVGVFDGDDAPGNVAIYDFARRSWTPLTSHPAEDGRPLWTPDGSRVAFRSFREGTSQLYLQSANGTSSVDRLTDGANEDRTPWSFSPDGRELVFSELFVPSYDLKVLNLSRGGTRTLPRTNYFKGSPTISPNGRWIAYRTEESGHDEVYVRPFADWDKNRTQVSATGGHAPVWSANGRELFFVNDDAMMVASVRTSEDFTAATPKLLFKGSYVEGPGGATNYDVARDGRRFLMIKEVGRNAEPPPRDRVVVVLNWADEVRQALASAK